MSSRVLGSAGCRCSAAAGPAVRTGTGTPSSSTAPCCSSPAPARTSPPPPKTCPTAASARPRRPTGPSTTRYVSLCGSFGFFFCRLDALLPPGLRRQRGELDPHQHRGGAGDLCGSGCDRGTAASTRNDAPFFPVLTLSVGV